MMARPKWPLEIAPNSSPMDIATEEFTNLGIKVRSKDTELYSFLPFYIIEEKRHAHEVTKNYKEKLNIIHSLFTFSCNFLGQLWLSPDRSPFLLALIPLPHSIHNDVSKIWIWLWHPHPLYSPIHTKDALMTSCWIQIKVWIPQQEYSLYLFHTSFPNTKRTSPSVPLLMLFLLPGICAHSLPLSVNSCWYFQAQVP